MELSGISTFGVPTCGSQLRVESGYGVLPDSCGGVKQFFSGSWFCTNQNIYKAIVFSTPFTVPPNVIITLSGAGTPPVCMNGAVDQTATSVTNITTAGFHGLAWASPVTGNCGLPYDSLSAPMRFNWTAIGY